MGRFDRECWAFSWASPLWSAGSCGPLAGPAHCGPQNLVGLYLGRPIMVCKIVWAFSWAGPLWSAKSYGPSVGPAHLIFVGHFWAGPRVNIS